ncbi:serine/threonine protein kinase [Candidatus Bathyarchaeota archaeon]|nr:serine/threonine protein kinase [Candidatus Bathyarchaeota archaeon]
MSEQVPVDKVLDNDVGRFVCWPVHDEEDALRRVEQLRWLGVESLGLGGRHAILGYPLLGKGHVGVVLLGVWRGCEAAVKIRRTDADRVSMEEEARLLGLANDAGVGPKLYAFSRDVLIMERLAGPYFGEWARGYGGDAEEFRAVVRGLLDKARSLDRAGLDHGELNRMRRHFIVTETGAEIIDFESASTVRRVRNLTASVQSMFMSRRFSPVMKPWFQGVDEEQLLEALRRYKDDPSDEKYLGVLGALGLE